MYRTVSFLCAEPVEWEYDDRGDPVTPGGKELTEQIAAALAGRGCRTSEVEQHEDYGWSFVAQVGSDTFHQVVNPVDRDVYLTIEMEGVLLKRLLLRRPQLSLQRYCDLVGASLASIPGVSGIQWEEGTSVR